MEIPFILNFERKVNNKKGYLICLEDYLVNINFKRVFWITGFEGISREDERGNHGHSNANEIIIPLKGSCLFKTTNIKGEQKDFFINTDQQGLFLPEKHMLIMSNFSEDALLLVICDVNFKDDKIIYS